MIAEIIEDDVATKSDLKELEYRLLIKLTAIMASMLTLSVAVISVVVNIHG